MTHKDLLQLSPLAMYLYYFLLDVADAKGIVCISRRKLATMLGWRDDEVRRTLYKLCETALISPTENPKQAQRKAQANIYVINYKPCSYMSSFTKVSPAVSPNQAQRQTQQSEQDFDPSTDYGKFRLWMRKNAPYILSHFDSTLTETEFAKLKEKYTGLEVANTIEQIENRKDLRKRYTSLYRTLLNWLKNEYGERT